MKVSWENGRMGYQYGQRNRITYPNDGIQSCTGGLKDGEKDGQGTFTFSDGERYVG